LTAFKARSISAAVFPAPSENRIVCRDAADSGFIALTLCDGSSASAACAKAASSSRAWPNGGVIWKRRRRRLEPLMDADER